MPRNLLIRSDLLPYHVTGRVNRRALFPIPLDLVWDTFSKLALLIQIRYGVEIHAFVLMPNHFHMILTVPKHDLGIVMEYFMREVSKEIGRNSWEKGVLFGGPYYPSIIQDANYFMTALKYVYRNPVKAGLCKKVEEWTFSTLTRQLGSGHLPFPLYFTRVGFDQTLYSMKTEPLLAWLNQPFPSDVEEAVRKGLKRSEFGPPKTIPAPVLIP